MHYLGIFHSERWKIRHRPVLAMHCLVWCLSCVNLTKMYGYCWGFVSYGLILVFGLQPKFGDVKNSTSWCQATSLRPGEGSQPTVNICLTSFVFWSTHRWKDQAEEKLVLPSCKPASSKLLMLIDLRNQAIWSKHHKIKESECQLLMPPSKVKWLGLLSWREKWTDTQITPFCEWWRNEVIMTWWKQRIPSLSRRERARRWSRWRRMTAKR